MRYAVSNLHRTQKRTSSPLDSTTSSVPNSQGFYPFTLIQTIIFILFCCQFIILTYLYFHFDLFQHSSLYDFKKSFILSSSHSSSHLLSPQEIQNNKVVDVNNEEKPRREIPRTKIQAIEELKYEIYPVTIRSIDKTDHMKPSSKELVKSLLDPVVEVDFPDLAYWTSESIKERYPTMFNELPKLGLHDNYKNPCWFRSMDSSNNNVDGGTSSVSRLVCLPYAYILGQPKSGTSDLFERLKAHPSIIMPTRKEVRWFTRGEFTLSAIPHEGEESDFTGGGEERRGERLLGKGSSIFTFTRAFIPLARALSTQPNRKNEFVTIDGGPHTLWWPTQAPDGEYLTKDVPPVQLIHELQPNAKFLITVVDPVKRFYSDYYFLGDDLKPVKPGRVGVKSPEQLHERVTEQINLFNVCIKRYMKRLVPQYQELKKKNSDANNQLFDDLPQLLKENNIKLDLSREYLTYFPLWFRSAQMCAHDRHTFAKGGWGRLSISLYILYLEKWYEYFPIDQFHIIRLEDYPNNPKQYLQSIFSFLNLPIDTDMKKEEEIWNKILVDKHYNQHRIARQPLLEETETLLRDFYRPYNQLLALVLRNQSFLWDPITSLGLTKTLREQLIEELKQPLPQQGKNGRITSPPSPFLPPAKPQENQHSPERSKIFLHEDTEADVPPEQNPSQNLRGNSKPRGLLQLTPHAFSIDDLPLPPPKDKTVPDEPTNNDDLTIFDGIDWTDTLTAGKHLCGAAFSLNLYHLKYLLYDIGIPSGTIYQNDGKRNAWHCLASIWSMGEAHSRSHVFAELKGRTTWVTNHLHPPLEKKIASVLSMDILSHLEEDILKVAQWLDRAKVPINAVDVGGFTPLHHAVVGGEVGLIKFLISLKEIDINKLDHMHRNPLHYAAAYGHSEIIQLLVEKGGNIRQIDRHGVTPYDIIATPGPVSAEDALLYANITQRPARKIKRYLHPEYYSNDSVYGWVGGTGGWGAERLQGFEEDMECNGIDQYLWNEITSADIFSKYLSKNTPVLIRGLLNYWPVVKTFKQENLIKSFGEIRVQVSDIPYAQKFGGSDMVEMTLAEYIEEVKNHRLIGGQHPWYVFRGHPIPQGSESKTSFVKHDTCPLPDLIKNAFLSACPIPPESGREREMFVNAQWALGGEGTGAPVHFHNTAWAALLYGAKKWLIYPPHAMIMSNKQILNYYETDRITFEERGIKPITCVQTAGDVMIIPESYGHGVLNIQESIAIATEFKHSMWRIRPPPRIVGEVSEFDNRSDKKNNRPREARRVRKARPVN